MDVEVRLVVLSYRPVHRAFRLMDHDSRQRRWTSPAGIRIHRKGNEISWPPNLILDLIRPRQGLQCDVVDPNVFNPIPHFTTQAIFKLKGFNDDRHLKGLHLPSLTSTLESSVGINQAWVSSKNGHSHMLDVKIEPGSFYSVLCGLLQIEDMDAKTLCEFGAAASSLPSASASLVSASASLKSASASLPSASPLVSFPLASVSSNCGAYSEPELASSEAQRPASVDTAFPRDELSQPPAQQVRRPRYFQKSAPCVVQAACISVAPALALAAPDVIGAPAAVMACSDMRLGLWLDWSTKIALAVVCRRVAHSDLEFFGTLKFSFKIESLIFRRLRILQMAGLDLPTALGVMSAAIASWRFAVTRLHFAQNDVRNDLIVDVMLTLGIAVAPLPAESAKRYIRARHQADVFDTMVMRCMTILP
jgi:hypothetical protein